MSKITASFMTGDIEEAVVTYDSETLDVISWIWLQPTRHALFGMNIDPTGRKSFMDIPFEGRIWEQGYDSNDLFLECLGLDHYDYTDIAEKTYAIAADNPYNVWVWIHKPGTIRPTWKEVCKYSDNLWALLHKAERDGSKPTILTCGGDD